MGSFQSRVGPNDIAPLSTLLEAETVDWELVRQSLREVPEQACLYAHGLEPSPLFIALKREAPVDVIDLLIIAYEDALDQPSPGGESTLHLAKKSSASTGLILKKRPLLAQSPDHLGRLPLHLCTNADAARQLIKAYPQALSQRTRESGSLPLHYAAQQESLDKELLNVLVEQNEQTPNGAILARNKKGETPLSLLVQFIGSNEECIDNLWDVLLHWIQVISRGEQLLHSLIEYRCCSNVEVMTRALKDFSDQAHQRDRSGRTPLHIAASVGCTQEALDVLIRANPSAPRMTDKEGRLPIDLAAESPYTHLSVLALLMKGEPRAVDTRDLRDGHYPFLSAALGENKGLNNTYFLLRAKPHVLSYFHTP